MQSWQSQSSLWHGRGPSEAGDSLLPQQFLQQSAATDGQFSPAAAFASHEPQRIGHANKLTISSRERSDFIHWMLLIFGIIGKIDWRT